MPSFVIQAYFHRGAAGSVPLASSQPARQPRSGRGRGRVFASKAIHVPEDEMWLFSFDAVEAVSSGKE
jgi:hypothetical protein